MIQYSKDISQNYQALTRDEQIALYNQMQDGSNEARDKIVNSCLPLAVKLASKFRINNKHIDIDDLIQEANMAVLNAVDHWNGVDNSITTVVTVYVRNALIDMIHLSNYHMKYPVSFSKRAAYDLHKVKTKNGNIPLKKVKQMKKFINKTRSTINQGSPRYHYNPSNENVSHEYCMADLEKLVNNHFSEIEKDIFCKFYGISNNKKHTTREICKLKVMTEQDVKLMVDGMKCALKKLARLPNDTI